LLRYDLKTLADRVEPAAFDEYRKTVSALYRSSSYSMSVGPLIVPRSPTWLFVAAAVWALALAGAMFLVQRYQPYLRSPSVPYDPRRAGRRGLLLLVGTGVFVTPFYALASLKSSWNAFGAIAWTVRTNPDSAAYDSRWAAALGTTLLFQILVIVVGFYMAYLFLRQRRSFPLLFVAFNGVSALALLLLSMLMPRASAKPSIVAVVSAIVWAVYGLRSRRMKATFLPAELVEEPISSNGSEAESNDEP
jgi:drug/metabolite transporter (DMT)-like permease